MPDEPEASNRELERGWQLLEEGETVEARQLAESLREQDPDWPEVHVLLAACAQDAEQIDRALEHLEEAARLDPEWAEPALRAAEIHAEGGDLPAALAQVGTALDKADEEDELLDAIALKAAIELEMGKENSAARTLALLPTPGATQPGTDVALEIGGLFLELGRAKEATGWLRRAVEMDEENADAYHVLGLAAELLDDESQKRQAWLKTHALDEKADRGEPLRLSDAQITQETEAALAELPENARKLLADVPILVVDRPPRSDVETGTDPRLLGLFDGTPYSEGAALGGVPQLTQIILFRRNLERIAEDDGELRAEIRTTLLHETGHFFGMSEKDLESVGLG